MLICYADVFSMLDVFKAYLDDYFQLKQNYYDCDSDFLSVFESAKN